MLRFTDGEQFFEMDLRSVEEDASLPSCGDAVVSVRVASHGYAGQNDVWVQKEDLARFCSSLISLERSLNGEAAIVSMSPNELSLQVLAVSSRGHLAVQGSTGHHIHGENRTYWHAISFGFEFEQSQLSEAVRESWVRRHVG